MNQMVRCTVVNIPKKLQVHIRLSVTERNPVKFTNVRDDTKNVSLNIYPTINVQITRPSEMDENGKFKRAPWDPEDTIGMTKYNFPIFVNELIGINKDMRTPNLYTYQGNRLELNEDAASKIRRVFVIGNTTLELSAVVIIQEGVDGDQRLEGIKLKFNNEKHSVLLTLNDLESLVFNLTHLEIDTLSMLMYLSYVNKPDHPTSFDTTGATGPKPAVDIQPIQKSFASPDDNIDEFAT